MLKGSPSVAFAIFARKKSRLATGLRSLLATIRTMLMNPSMSIDPMKLPTAGYDEFDLDLSNMVPRHEVDGLAALAYEDGRRAERVRIVEWLRARSQQRGIDWKFRDDEDSGLPSTALREAADLIEDNKETL